VNHTLLNAFQALHCVGVSDPVCNFVYSEGTLSHSGLFTHRRRPVHVFASARAYQRYRSPSTKCAERKLRN